MNRENMPLVAVRLEGTLTVWDDDSRWGDPDHAAIDALNVLGETNRIVVVSPQVADTVGKKRVAEWLRVYGVSYDDLWDLPSAPDIWIDNKAGSLP